MSASRGAVVSSAVPFASGRAGLHNDVHDPASKLSALQGVHGARGGGLIEFDEGVAARTARTIAGDPQRAYLSEWREDGAQIAGASVRR
jgi:hypothetical protein